MCFKPGKNTVDDPLVGEFDRELLTNKAAPDATHAAGGAAGGTDDEDAGGDVEDGGESTAPAEYQTGFVWRYT